jgi:hypothetical protein
MRNRRVIGVLLGMATTAFAAPGLAQDLYVGTVDVQKDQVILTRCDLVQNRYVLRDREGDAETPVARLRDRLKTLKAPVYVEVIGEYAEVGGDNALDVIGLENLTPGKSCHLIDALPGG